MRVYFCTILTKKPLWQGLKGLYCLSTKDECYRYEINHFSSWSCTNFIFYAKIINCEKCSYVITMVLAKITLTPTVEMDVGAIRTFCNLKTTKPPGPATFKEECLLCKNDFARYPHSIQQMECLYGTINNWHNAQPHCFCIFLWTSMPSSRVIL